MDVHIQSHTAINFCSRKYTRFSVEGIFNFATIIILVRILVMKINEQFKLQKRKKTIDTECTMHAVLSSNRPTFYASQHMNW